jgi:hypothetical protein
MQSQIPRRISRTASPPKTPPRMGASIGREAFSRFVPLAEGDGTDEGVGIVDDELVSTPAIEIELQSGSPKDLR